MSRGQDGIAMFELWKQYEQIAIHFNDLIMRLVSRSIGTPFIGKYDNINISCLS